MQIFSSSLFEHYGIVVLQKDFVEPRRGSGDDAQRLVLLKILKKKKRKALTKMLKVLSQ